MEIFKDIPGYEGLYQVSNLGNVKNIKRGTLVKSKLLHGYVIIRLNKNGFRKMTSIHRLMAQAFIPNPENKPQINHKNGIKDDNRLENMEWCNNSENQLHSYNVLGRKPSRSSLGKKGKDCCFSVPVKQYKLDGSFIRLRDSMADVSRELGIASCRISIVCSGKRNKTAGFIWQYA